MTTLTPAPFEQVKVFTFCPEFLFSFLPTHGFRFNFSIASGTIVENPTAQTHLENMNTRLLTTLRTGALANHNDLEAMWLKLKNLPC